MDKAFYRCFVGTGLLDFAGNPFFLVSLSGYYLLAVTGIRFLRFGFGFLAGAVFRRKVQIYDVALCGRA